MSLFAHGKNICLYKLLIPSSFLISLDLKLLFRCQISGFILVKLYENTPGYGAEFVVNRSMLLVERNSEKIIKISLLH